MTKTRFATFTAIALAAFVTASAMPALAQDDAAAPADGTSAAQTGGAAATIAPAAKSDPASVFVQKLGDKALTSLTAHNIDPAEREGRVRDLLRNNFDEKTIGRFALGRHWNEATDAQKDEYFKLFEAMIVRTYSQRFADYSGQSFKVGRSAPSGEDQLVDSQIIQQGGPPVNVQWRVRTKGGQSKIVDVLVEGISMSVTQRSDFDSVIQQGGGKFDALLQSLRNHQLTVKTK